MKRKTENPLPEIDLVKGSLHLENKRCGKPNCRCVLFGPGALRETKTVKRYMVELSEHGWLIELPKGSEVDGAPRQLAYRIVRA